MQVLPRSRIAIDVPVVPKRILAHAQLFVSEVSVKWPARSTAARIVYVPPFSPVMSMYWKARVQAYLSAHPTLIPLSVNSDAR